VSTVARKLSAWFTLSRPPFHTVGVLPFALGSILAFQQEGLFQWPIFAWGMLMVILVMLASYHAGEYWDYAEDVLSGQQGGSRFAGGSQIVQRGLLPRRAPFWGSLVSVFLALTVALMLQVGYGTGPWTILFTVLGVIGGFFYSTRPIRWVSTGVGEVWIGFCYGWLATAVGYYLQVGRITSLIHWLAIPIGLTIFNVILLNEFPDYLADAAAGKKNLVVRLGRERASLLYGMANLGSWVGMGLSIERGVPAQALWLYLPILGLSVILVTLVTGGRWRDRAFLEVLCGANLAVNLGTTVVYVLAFVG
jgi:1,4-dihydroxy-2-naphthoate octaprenyltransferase